MRRPAVLRVGASAEGEKMHSEAYLDAIKEFINCLCMTIIGLGVPLVLAFKEWLPIMREEKRKERLAQKA